VPPLSPWTIISRPIICDDDDDDDDDYDDIYLLQVDFHPVATVGRLVQKWERHSTRRETIHKTIQKLRVHKIENKNTKQT